MIRFCSNIKAFANIGVIGVCNSASCRYSLTFNLSAIEIVGTFIRVGILLSTLSELNENKSLAAKPALIFLRVNALFLARLYKDVKCFLPIIFT